MPITPALVERFPLPQKPGKPLRLGLIGLGGIFEHSHLPALRHVVEAGWPVEVAALCDVSAERIAAMRRYFPEARAQQDMMGLLKDDGLDAILAFTPPKASERIVQEMIGRAGRKVPLFVEKPVCHSPARLEELAKATNGQVVQVAYNRRSQPLAAEYRTMLAELPGGRPEHVVARFWRSSRAEPEFYPDTLGHPLDFLAYCLGPLKLQRVRRWPTLGKTQLPAGVHVELTAGDVTVELDSRPSVGRACETYESLGRGVSVAMGYSPVDIGGDPVMLQRFEKRNEKVLANFPATGMSAEDRSYLRGFAHQLAGFFRLAAGKESKPVCTLQDAAAAMRLIDEIMHAG